MSAETVLGGILCLCVIVHLREEFKGTRGKKRTRDKGGQKSVLLLYLCRLEMSRKMGKLAGSIVSRP